VEAGEIEAVEEEGEYRFPSLSTHKLSLPLPSPNSNRFLIILLLLMKLPPPPPRRSSCCDRKDVDDVVRVVDVVVETKDLLDEDVAGEYRR